MSQELLNGGIEAAYKLASEVINPAYAASGDLSNFSLGQPAIFPDGVEDTSITREDWPSHDDDSTNAIIAAGATPAGLNIVFPCTATNGDQRYANAEMLRRKYNENGIRGVQSYIDANVAVIPQPVGAGGGFTEIDPTTGEAVPVPATGGVSFVDPVTGAPTKS